MKGKRILSIVLAVFMILSTMSFTVLADDTEVVLEAGTYTSLSDYAGKTMTIKAAEGAEVVFEMGNSKPNLNGANLTFEGITFNWDATTDYKGLQHAGNLKYVNCTINGKVFLYGTSELFEGCTFNQTAVDYNVWTYGAKIVKFNNCKFYNLGKCVLVYSDQADASTDLTVEETDFIASQEAAGKAAIEIDTSLMGGNTTVTVDEATTANGFSEETISGNSLWNVKKDPKVAQSTTVVTVAEETVYAKVVDTEGNVKDPVADVNGVPYASVQSAIDAAQAGDIVKIMEGTYAVPTMKPGITVVGEGEVLLEGTLTGTLENLTLKNLHIKGTNAQRWAYAKGDLVFENVTFEATSVYALHFDGTTSGTNLLYKDCTIIGWAAMGGDPASCVFDGCTIKDNGTYGVIRTYFDAEINDCTFDVDGANPDDVYQDGIHAVNATVQVNNCTNVNGDMKDIINVSSKAYIYVDDELALAPEAKIGEEYYGKLTSAITEAQNGDVIDLLGGTVALSGTQQITVKDKDITFTNGTIDITGVDIAGNAIWLVNNSVLTFDKINLIGDGYDSAFGVFYLVTDNAGLKLIDSTVNLNADGKSGGFVKGDGYMGTVLIDNTDITLVATNRGFISTEVTIQNDSHVSISGDKSLANYGIENAFNICGITLKDTSTIDIRDCYEYGIKIGDAAINIEDTAKVVATGSGIADIAHRKLENTGVLTVAENASVEAEKIVLNNTAQGNGSVVSKADSIYVQYKKTDLDDAGKDNLEGSDTYEIVLAGADAEKINELASADLTFDFVGTPFDNANMSYTVTPANGVTLTQIGDRYMFNYNGVDKYEESGTAIVIGTITVNGYGTYTLGTDADATTNAVYATEIRDSIVDGFESIAELKINSDMVENDGMVGNIDETTIKVPTRKLTVDIEFNNAVNDNVKAYQDMKVTISGGDLTENIVVDLGNDYAISNVENDDDTVTYANGYEIVLADELTLNTTYVVTVEGAGYRTARANVTMTEDKTVTFWNNVKDVEGANYLAGDIVKDNTINLYDLSAVVSYFGTNNTVTAKSDYAKYDLNRDGKIDSKDVAYVLVSWGN